MSPAELAVVPALSRAGEKLKKSLCYVANYLKTPPSDEVEAITEASPKKSLDTDWAAQLSELHSQYLESKRAFGLSSDIEAIAALKKIILTSPVSITLLPPTVLNEQLYQRKLGGLEGHIAAFEGEQLGNFYMVSFAFAEYIGQVFKLINKHRDALIAKYKSRKDEPLLKILSGLMMRADNAERYESEGVKLSAYKEEWLGHYKNYLLAKEYYLAALRGWLMVEGLEDYPGTHALMAFRKAHSDSELHSFEMQLLKGELNEVCFTATAATLKKQAMERVLRKKYYYEACAILLADLNMSAPSYLKIEDLSAKVRSLIKRDTTKPSAEIGRTISLCAASPTVSFRDPGLMKRLQKRAKERTATAPASKPLPEENKNKSKGGKKGGKGKGDGRNATATGSATLAAVRVEEATKDQDATLSPPPSVSLTGDAGDERDGEEDTESHTATDAVSFKGSLPEDALDTAEKDVDQIHSSSASSGSEEADQIDATEGSEGLIASQQEIIPVVVSVEMATTVSERTYSSDEDEWEVVGSSGKAKGHAKDKESLTATRPEQQSSPAPKPYLAAAMGKTPRVPQKAKHGSSAPKPSVPPTPTVVASTTIIRHAAAIPPYKSLEDGRKESEVPLVVVARGDDSVPKDTMQLVVSSVSATAGPEIKQMVSAGVISTEDASYEDEIDDVLSSDYWNIIDKLKTAGLLKEMGFSDLSSRLKDIESTCSALSLPEQKQLLAAELESVNFRINFLDCVRSPSLETRATLYQSFFYGQKMNFSGTVVTAALLDAEEKQFMSGLQRARAAMQKERKQLVEWQQRLATKLPG